MTGQQNSQPNFDPREAFYTGPGTLGGRYLRSFWQPIRLSKDISAGRAASIKIMGQDYTLYRGETGTVHLVDNRCAHRGTQLSVGQIEGDAIRCYYHGWKYDQNGQCIQQPGEPRPFCDKIKIGSYPVREYLGLIFAYLGEGEPPAFFEFEHFDARADNVRSLVEVAPFNYFQRMENSHDFVHLPFVHRQCYSYDGDRSLQNVIPRVTSEECSWGIRSHRIDPNGLDITAYFGMPNINYILIGGGTGKEWDGEGEMLFWRVPVDDHNHLQFMLLWAKGLEGVISEGPTTADLVNEKRNAFARSILMGQATIDDAIAASEETESSFLFGVEDDVAMIGQGIIWDRENEHLGGADVGVAFIRRLWARDLRALWEGKPLQQWTRTPDMVPEVVALPHDVLDAA